VTVGECPIVEFDHHDRAFHQRRHDEWAELRRCPVAFNPRYGGYWVISGYDEVNAVSRDGDTFSSRHAPEPLDGITFLGIAGIPRPGHLPTVGIAEAEGGLHHDLRRVINPFLVPKAVDAMEAKMAAAATWFVDQHVESGAMDLVLDVLNPVPAIFTMELIGLPPENWKHYADLFHATIAYRPGNPAYDRAVARAPEMLASLKVHAADRRATPRDDLLTALVGLGLDDDQLGSVLWNLIGGGLDTTTSLSALTLLHLDAHPEQRRRLVEDPSLLPTATEEFLRFFSVNESLTRTVTRDVELGGQQLRRGDHLMLSWLSANRDAAVFDDADDVVLDRAPNPHLAFGVGPHRCIGMHLARTMFRVLVREVLTRLPDYVVDRGATELYDGNPELNGVVRLPVTFTPGPRVGPAERPF
jgi:cytochrome P450